MSADPDLDRIERVAAYLGARPEEVASDLRRGVSVERIAERYGRPDVGVREVVA